MKEAATQISPSEKPQIRFLSAIYFLNKSLLEPTWKSRWERNLKSRHLFNLTPGPTRAVHKLHTGVLKAYSSLIVQLRIGKIGFNAFLHERRVPDAISPRCDCDLGIMTVYHVLLICPRWRELRQRFLAWLKTSDLRQLLNTTKGLKAVVQFTLATDLLPQFQRIAREEQENRS